MIAETKYCLANLANFNGRDSRATFWWYMLAIIILQVVLGALLAGPMMAGMMGSLAESAQQGISPEAAQAQALGTMFSSMQDWLIYGTVLAVISVILFAAAFVRRLHDSNKPGWIVLIPIATTAISQVMGYQFINDALPAMQAAMEAGDFAAMAQLQQDMQGYSAISYIGYLVAIVFGVMNSTPGPNRYGDASA